MFTNLCVMRLPQSAAQSLIDPAANDLLAEHRIRPCGPNEIASLGFSSPRGEDFPDELVCVVNHRALIQVHKCERIIPPQIIDRETNARVKKNTSGKVPQRERRRIRDEVVAELLERAFEKETSFQAYIDPQGEWFVVDTANRSSAEDVARVLRLSLGSFPAIPMGPEVSVGRQMTNWLRDGTLPEGLSYGSDCELQDPANKKSVWRGRNIEIESTEVQEHIEAGMVVSQLALVFEKRVSFVLDEDLCLRKWRLLDIVLEEADTGKLDRSQLDVQFNLLTNEANRVLACLEQWFQLAKPAGRKAA